MLAKMDVQSNIREIAELLGVDSKETVTAAAVSALNKTAAKAKTGAARQIRDAGFKLKVSAIKDDIFVIKAWKTKLVSSVKAKGRPIALINFLVKQTADGCVVRVKGQAKLIRHSFVAVMPNGNKGIFERSTKSRLPIDQLYTIGVPSMFMSKVVNDQIRKQIVEDFPAVFRGELSWKAFKVRR